MRQRVAFLREAALVAMLLAPPVAPVAFAQLATHLSHHLDARGGADALRKVRSARATGQLRLPDGRTAPFLWEWKKPGQVRMQFTLQGRTSIQAFDGTTAWAVLPLLGQFEPQPLPKSTADLFRLLQGDFAGPLLDLEQKGHTAQLVGEDRVGDRPAIYVRLTLRDGRTLHTFLDRDTHLEIRQVLEVDSESGPVQIEVLLSDYRAVSGLMLAHTITSRPKGGVSSQTMTFEQIKLGVTIDDQRFRMPVQSKPAEQKP